jgi:protein phosphatase 1 regulatory subunit 7
LDGLETLVDLEELYLQQNQVTSFAGLLNNTRLQTLDLAVNKLSRFDDLDHLSDVLKELWLNWN